MKHQNSIRKFGRVRNQRKALLRSLALALIDKGKIKTTEAKAKELRPFIEKIVSRARTNSLYSRRLVRARLGKDNKKLFDDIAERYTNRQGGYTRIVKLGFRSADGARMAIIEFVK